MSIQLTISPKDKRSFKYLQLPNKIRCILISDMEADKAAASIGLPVGSSFDPKEFGGLAHFLEHMLFCGSEKYPRENDYMEYISNHGGYDNAMTSTDDTNYYFECSNEGFEGALDRLAQFFICPNFSENCTNREVRAVDSEFIQSQQSEFWPYFYLMKSMANPDSPFSWFDFGNLEALEKEGIRESLLDFHKKYYSANLLALTVVGKFDLDTLEKWVTEKFSAVVNNEVVLPPQDLQPIFPADRLSKLVKFVPVRDKDTLELVFKVPYCEMEHYTSPEKYMVNLIGHEGENSLLSFLKFKDLAIGLDTDMDHSMKCFTQFQISITLTKKGLENYEEVVEATFGYLQAISKIGPQESFAEEMKAIGEMNFTFADKQDSSDTARKIARRMHVFDDSNMKDILRTKYIVDQPDFARIQELMDELTKPENILVFLASPSFKDKLADKEYWYKTQYEAGPISDELLKKMKVPQCQMEGKIFGMPPANPLIPKDFTILDKLPELSGEPLLVKRWPGCTDLWFKKDDYFETPKVDLTVNIYTKDLLFSVRPASSVFVKVWKQVVLERLREFSYQASLANLNFSLSIGNDHIQFEWKGYGATMELYVQEVLQRIMSLKGQDFELEFNQAKEKLLQDFKNFYMNSTYRVISPLFSTLITNLEFEKKTLIPHLQEMTYKDFQELHADWLVNGRSVWYAEGNLTDKQAIAIVEQAREKLALKPVKIEELVDVRTVQLEQGTSFLFEYPIEDPQNENSGCYVYYQLEPQKENIPLYVLNYLVMSYLDEPFFDQLRTKQQLGYAVFCSATSHNDVIGSKFVIQAPKHSAEYCVHQINEFLVSMGETVKAISDEDFETRKNAVKAEFDEKDTNMYREADRLFGDISTHKYNFKRKAQRLAALATISKEEFIGHYTKMFLTSEASRLDFEMTSQKHSEQQAEYKVKNGEHQVFKQLKRVQIEDSLMEFKLQSGLFPDVFKANFATKDYERQKDD